MNDVKRQAIKVASERLAKARERFNMASMAPSGSENVEFSYQLALAEVNEAEAECRRVTSAEFQPEE